MQHDRTPKRSEHLVIQTAFLGDLLLTIPLLKNLRRLKPDDRITIVLRRGLGTFLRETGLVDEVVEVDKSDRQSRMAARHLLETRRFELLLCAHQSPRSTLLARSLDAQTKIGYRGFLRGLVFDELVERPMEVPEALRLLALLENQEPQGDLARGRAEFTRMQALPGGQSNRGELSGGGPALTAVPEWAAMTLPGWLQLRHEFSSSGRLDLASSGLRDLARQHHFHPNRLICLAPGSIWATKMWTKEGFAGVGAEFSDQDFTVVLLGSADEAELCDQVAREVIAKRRNQNGRIVNLAGKTSLLESSQLLALSTLLIANDSGAMHLAALAGVPTISIFGPTILEFGYRPWNLNGAVLEVPQAEISCRPCGKHGAKTCPRGTHECMTRIPAVQVISLAQRILQRGKLN